MLHYAARDNATELVEVLLAEGQNPNSLDPCGATPLHWAVAAGSLDSMALLLAHGADAHCADRFGNTPNSVADNVPKTAEALKKGLLVPKVPKKASKPTPLSPTPPPRAAARNPIHADSVLYADISFPLFNLFGERRGTVPLMHSEYAEIDHQVTSEIRASLDLGRT